ncbi:phosphatidylinositol-3,5-bisphosphate 3-phosphatase [Aureococcus anophagefferens]|nr:phosphatidylinositol-3,5-bisphosphate 3-phosphatase [Aureococcus anophagefferens]
MGIANIHAVRAAHDGLVDAVCGRGDFAAACASSSGWFALLQRLLAAVVHVVDAVARHGVPVLVHCSDGWDRTPQLTAGSMLLMDPFYRTIRGFAVLVEKEWCACGHKFAERHGFDDKGHASSDRSPCFLQWIDLVHQVRRQAPDAFEFNVEFLVTVAAAASDGWTGTFLFDCDRLREAHKLKDRAVSLWSHVEARRRDFKNPTYRPDDRVIYPLAAAPKTQLAAVQDMEGITMPMGLFDPFGFSNGCSDEALAWYREAEIKHGRVAMAAFVGFLVNYQGYTFPANLDMSGNKFASLGTGNPLLAWDNLSEKGKWSILGFVGLLEVLGEAEKPHYTKGGKSGSHELVWYFGSKYISGKSPEDRLRSRNAEINNGRLGMLGIMSLIAASTVPGSVPFFTSDLAQYTGDVWAPF